MRALLQSLICYTVNTSSRLIDLKRAVVCIHGKAFYYLMFMPATKRSSSSSSTSSIRALVLYFESDDFVIRDGAGRDRIDVLLSELLLLLT